MDVELLATTLQILMREAAPQLQEWGGQATEAALKSFVGEKAKQAAQALGWLKPKVEDKPMAEGSVKALAAEVLDPEDAAEAETTLHKQLVKILTADQDLCAALFEQLEGVEVPRAGVAAGRDVNVEQIVSGDAYKITGGTVTIVHGGATLPAAPAVPAARDESSDARASYLSWVMARTGLVALGGVDPAVGRAEDRRLHLDAVYTALRTRTPRRTLAEPAGGKPAAGGDAAPRHGLIDRDEPPLSALEQLDRHRRLALLGDPGSGKSTFVDFVALCLAGELHPQASAAGLELLTAPLPRADGSDAEERQPWNRGPLLPVRVVLRDFAARGLPEDGQRPAAEYLWHFLEAELSAGRQADFVPALEAALKAGEALVLLDGLDEVPEASRRRELLCRTVECFVDAYPESRFVVTSRTYAYQQQDFHLEGFAVAELAPFDAGQIRRFARRWYAEVAELKGLLEEQAQGRAALLERAVFGSARLRELASRPLLLTLMASLHAFRGGSLPEDREKLYDDTVELLLDVWEQQQKRHEGGHVVLEPNLLEYLKVERKAVLRALQELAYEVHARQRSLEGTADVPAGDLVGRLMELPAKSAGEDVDPKRLAAYLSQRAGILTERGERVYTFPHRTFQEYLAARHLVDGGFDYDQIARDARRDPGRWREVVLLAAARIGPLGVWELADALAFEDAAEEPAAGAWGLHLAGHAVAESANLEQVSPRNRRRLGDLRRRLAALLASAALPAKERALAGNNLARLGDPRFDSEAWFLPAGATAGFVAIAGGEYEIGSDPEQDSDASGAEQPRHTVKLSPYWLARWPVTVAQFRDFVSATGFEVGDKDSFAGVANHPVVRLSWDEARAYCKWLTERLREVAPERAAAAGDPAAARFWQGLAAGELRATLPSEARWEAAARGPEARLYPWGDEKPTSEHAKYGKTADTTAAGIYPLGRGPFGTEDQAGNVWEWCADVWDSKAYAKRDSEPVLDPCNTEGDEPADRVLRGGAWGYRPRYLRAAYRLGVWHRHRDWDVGFRVCVSGPEHD